MEEEEVDQLDSDTEEEAQPSAAGPKTSTTKTRPRAPVERVPGKSMIPLSRIETLLEADGVFFSPFRTFFHLTHRRRRELHV